MKPSLSSWVLLFIAGPLFDFSLLNILRAYQIESNVTRIVLNINLGFIFYYGYEIEALFTSTSNLVIMGTAVLGFIFALIDTRIDNQLYQTSYESKRVSMNLPQIQKREREMEMQHRL